MKFKFKPEMAVTLGLGVLSIAQYVLGQKKDANDMAKLKQDVIEEVMKKTATETK